MLYTDLECLLKPVTTASKVTNTTKEKRHIPSGFSYALIKETGELITHKVYRGIDAMKIFLEDCLAIASTVMEAYDCKIPLQMTAAEEDRFQKSTKCHICTKLIRPGRDLKCRDHNHLTGKKTEQKIGFIVNIFTIIGKFRGASHQHCNLNFKQKQFLPVVVMTMLNILITFFSYLCGYSDT